MKHKSLQLVGTLLVSATLLVGCSTSNTSTTDSTNTNTSTESSAGSTEAAESKTYGQITAIDGSSITVAIGTKKQRTDNGDGASSKNKDKKPSGTPDANASTGENNTPPSGQPEAPSESDSANSAKGNRPSMLDLTGETKTITVTDSTVITLKSQESSTTGSINDLEVGTTISFVLAEDGTTATSINKSSMSGGSKGEGHKQSSTEASTEASTK